MNVKNYVRALLCLYITIQLSIYNVHAQALKVGDALPSEFWNLPLQVLNHPEGKEAISLEEYKGKLIILDFWATWCTPCVAMLPKMDSLQKEFAGEVQILPLTYQSRKEVSEFMEKYIRRTGRVIQLPKVVEDKGLHQAFPHIYIPHYIWITSDGKIQAITGHEEITSGKIRAVLSRGEIQLLTKRDPTRIVFDSSKPFLVNGNGGDGSNLVYQSVLTTHSPGLKDGYSISVDSAGVGRLSLFNVPLYWFYRAAFGADSVWFGRNRIEINMKQPQRINYSDTSGTYEEWKGKYAFCYQLTLPNAKRFTLFNALRQDLNRMFPDIEAKIENRKKLCWVLARADNYKPLTGSEKPLDPKDKSDGYLLNNSYLKRFIDDMNVFTLQRSPNPLVDETGITDKFTMHIKADLNDMEAVANELRDYGLKLTQEYRDISILVFTDK